MKYLLALQASWLVQVIRPFSTRHATEIISIPKTYAFDTGFFCHFRGWQELRLEDFAILWKHWVLTELNSHRQGRVIHYWRDKEGHEVDFILITKEMGITAIVANGEKRIFSQKICGTSGVGILKDVTGSYAEIIFRLIIRPLVK